MDEIENEKVNLQIKTRLKERRKNLYLIPTNLVVGTKRKKYQERNWRIRDFP